MYPLVKDLDLFCITAPLLLFNPPCWSDDGGDAICCLNDTLLFSDLDVLIFAPGPFSMYQVFQKDINSCLEMRPLLSPSISFKS